MASAPVTLRPLSFGEILDGTFTLYRRYFLLFVGIAALPNAVLLIAQLVPQLLVGARASPQAGVAASMSMAGLLILVYLPLVFFSIGANCHAVSEIYLGRTTSVAHAYQAVTSAFWSLVGTAMLVGLAVGLAGIFPIGVGVGLMATKTAIGIAAGLLLLLFGVAVAIWLGLRFSLISPVVVLEQEGGIGAMRRSAFLLQKNLLRVFGVYAVFALIGMVAVWLFQMPLAVVIAVIATRQGPLAGSLGIAALSNFLAAISNTLVAPLLYIGITLLYYDTRIRKEAFDLQIMASLIRRPSPTPQVSAP